MNMSELVTKDDLRDVRDTIVEEMRAGFVGVYARQDKTNGRVSATEVVVGAHDVKLRNMEREVFRRRRSADSATNPDGPRRSIQQWDVLVFVAGVGATVAVLKALAWLGPLLVEAVNP